MDGRTDLRMDRPSYRDARPSKQGQEFTNRCVLRVVQLSYEATGMT